MNNKVNQVIRAYQKLQQGDFNEALNLAEASIEKDRDYFWAWFVACAAAAYMSNDLLTNSYIQKANLILANSPYITYLKAYQALRENDLEKALWEWTKITNKEEGWLAKNLLEKARKNEDLIEQAQKSNVGDFIILPEFINQVIDDLEQKEKELNRPANSNELEMLSKPIALEADYQPATEKEKANRSKLTLIDKLNPRLIFIGLTVFFIFLSFGLFKLIKVNGVNLNPNNYENLSIDKWANIVAAGRGEKVFYHFNSRKSLIQDFEDAKKKLKKGQINQCRYLLQRIIFSNADFRTKERSKIFLRFIPKQKYQDFTDHITISQLMKEPVFYQGATVLWQGGILRMIEVDKGKEVRLLIRDEKSDYIVESFYKTDKSLQNWKPLKSYKDIKKWQSDNLKKAIIYGTFKNLIGKDKKLYVELERIWQGD